MTPPGPAAGLALPPSSPPALAPPHHDLGPFAAGILLAVIAVTLRHPLPLALLLAATWRLAPPPRWPLAIIAGTGFIMNGLWSWHGETVLWRAPFTLALVGRPLITAEALASGLVTGLQIALAGAALMMALAQTPPQAVARLLPGNGPRMATLLALRAVPDTARDARAMRHALAARGIDTGGARGAAQLLVPLAARSLDRASDTLEIWYARGGDARARIATPIRLGWRGLLAVGLLVGWIALAVSGLTPRAEFFPYLALAAWQAPVTWLPLVAVVALPWRRP